MRIPKDLGLWLQNTLLEYNGWQWGLVSFAHGEIVSVPADTMARWQFAVDMIYRSLTCDLINVDVYMECHDRASFLSAIRTVEFRSWIPADSYGTEPKSPGPSA